MPNKKNPKQKKGPATKQPAAQGKQKKRQPQTWASEGTKKCAIEFGRSIINPCGSPPACAIGGNATPSLKQKFSYKGNFVQGSGGVGFVAFDPFSGAVVPTAATDYPVSWSASTYASSDVPSANTETGVSEDCLNTQHTQAQLGPTVLEWRLVSACLRVKFLGSDLANGGQLVGFSQPDHASLAGQTYGSLLADDGIVALSLPQARDWVEVIFKPGDLELEDYEDNIVSGYKPCMVFMCTGCDSTAVFAFEVYANYEFIGRTARGKSPSLIDPQARAAVINAASRLPNGAMRVDASREGGFLNLVQNIASGANVAVGTAEAIGPVLSRAFRLLA